MDYSLLYSIKMRYEDESTKEAKQRLLKNGDNTDGPPMEGITPPNINNIQTKF